MSYIDLARKHPRYLAYGAVHYFFSSLGQTFLISVSVPFIIRDLVLENSSFSNGYAIATIASALLLPLAGSWVDRSKFTTVSLAGGLGLVLACLTMFFVNDMYLLVAGLFLLRFFGQGGMILIGSTTIAKFFTKNRGKALSLASMGLAGAETFMPVLMVSMIAGAGWRVSWLLLGALVILIFLPSTNFLMRKDSGEMELDHSEAVIQDFTRRQVLKDWRFYLLLPAFVFLPFFITGIFIHQNLVAAAKGWSLEWMATCFIGYGIARIGMVLLGGMLIDRFTAKTLFVVYLLPMAGGLLLLNSGNHPVLGILYMILLGVTASLSSLTGVAIWAELYGVKNLGAIKSMVTTLMVVSTALGPIVIGYGLEQSFTGTLLTFTFVIFVIVIVNWLILRKG